jgi:hypothetical protein
MSGLVRSCLPVWAASASTAVIRDHLCGQQRPLVKTRRENLVQERQSLTRAVATLTRRLTAHPKASCPCRAPSRPNKEPKPDGCDDCQAGYASAHEAAMKRRRLDILATGMVRAARWRAGGEVQEGCWPEKGWELGFTPSTHLAAELARQ